MSLQLLSPETTGHSAATMPTRTTTPAAGTSFAVLQEVNHSTTSPPFEAVVNSKSATAKRRRLSPASRVAVAVAITSDDAAARMAHQGSPPSTEPFTSPVLTPAATPSIRAPAIDVSPMNTGARFNAANKTPSFLSAPVAEANNENAQRTS